LDGPLLSRAGLRFGEVVLRSARGGGRMRAPPPGESFW